MNGPLSIGDDVPALATRVADIHHAIIRRLAEHQEEIHLLERDLLKARIDLNNAARRPVTIREAKTIASEA